MLYYGMTSNKTKITVSGIYPPAIAILGGKTYVVPSYTEVPAGTTLDDIIWIPPAVTKPAYTTKHVGKYIITIYDSGRVTCDCPGYTFRKKCKHSAEYLT
jgi:hypothetical protein